MPKRSLIHREKFFPALYQEMKKALTYFSFQTKKGAECGYKALRFVSGEEVYADKATQEARAKHKALYEEYVANENRKVAEEKAKATRGMSMLQRWRYSMSEMTAGLKQATSVKQGSLAILQHCVAAHAAEIAMKHNVDIKSVQMQFEKQENGNSIRQEEVVVGYIDAPEATPEEVEVLASALREACPVARRMNIEWRKAPPRPVEQPSVYRDDDAPFHLDPSHGRLSRKPPPPHH